MREALLPSPALVCLLATAVVADPEWKTAATAFTETVTVPDGAGLTLRLRCGADGMKLALTSTAGRVVGLTLKPFDASLPGAAGTEPVALPEAGIEVPELRVRRYVRPNPAMLKDPARKKCLADWATLPPPSAHPLTFTLRPSSGGIDGYLDGQYAGPVLRDGGLRSVQVTVPPGSAWGDARVVEPVVEDRFLPLEIAPQDQPGALAGATVETAALGDSPVLAPSGANLDLGVTARQQDRYGSYTYRSGYDGLRESYLFCVPAAQYVRAWVLCAVEPGKDAGLTARLTRYVSGGPYTGRARDCLADTSLVLPAEARRVGSVKSGADDLPLYLVEVPLASGDIQDLLFAERPQRGTPRIGPYLDFELLGRLKPQDRPHPFTDDRCYPDGRFASGVHVFGVTLERTPVEMEVGQPQPGLIFCGDEEPELRVALRPLRAGDYELRWRLRDVAGRDRGQGRKPLSLKVADGEQTIPVSLRQPEPGWYEAVCELWQGERKLLDHRAAYALLPADTRQAGYESPYGTWWFDHHYGCADPRIAGPLLLKAGFRKAAYAVIRHTEAELAPWKVTASAVGWHSFGPQATEAQIETAIRTTVEKYPHCDNILVFHESMPGAPLGTRSATELFGLPVKEYPGADERWATATRVARLVRAKFPQLKIFLGNSGAASELIAEGLRRKFPRELADYVGIETVGRTGHPEKLWEGGLPGVWLLREIGRHHGVPWPVTSCYETNYRQERLLGNQRHAEWYVRDLLLSHAYRFPHIAIGLLYDAGNSYHASFWGSTGLCRRYPLLYPKPAYVAVATATRVLDRVTLQREVPTGSNCVYALEFARADGRMVYPTWTARGTAELRLAFAETSQVEVVELYGPSRMLPTPGGRLTLTAGTAVRYVIAPAALTAAAVGRRTYPEDQPPAGFRLAEAMADPARWRLASGQDPLLEQTSRPHLPFRTAGEFALRGVRDEERGDCLELELLPRRKPTAPLLSEYAVLRLAQPVTLPGQPTTLGVWVKGNSGWGQVYFEVEDAAGVRRVSCGTVVHDADVFDYDGRVSINFDGWAFLSFPITNDSPIPDLSTGSVYNLWEATDRSKAVTWPLKLTGLAVSVSRQALHLTEMTPIRQVVRLRDVGTCD